jgi:hypothetical protein
MTKAGMNKALLGAFAKSIAERCRGCGKLITAKVDRQFRLCERCRGKAETPKP